MIQTTSAKGAATHRLSQSITARIKIMMERAAYHEREAAACRDEAQKLIFRRIILDRRAYGPAE